jgi:hypothetical protein
MDKESLIPIRRVCQHYEIEISFVDSLYDLELIELTTIEEEVYIHHEAVSDLERLVRLHQDLNINLEGLGAVSHLLHKVNALQEEVQKLRKRVQKYERE